MAELQDDIGDVLEGEYSLSANMETRICRSFDTVYILRFDRVGRKVPRGLLFLDGSF